MNCSKREFGDHLPTQCCNSPSLPSPNIHCSTPPTHTRACTRTHTHTPRSNSLFSLNVSRKLTIVKRWPIFSKCLSLKLFLLFSPVCHLTVALLVLILTSWATQDLFSQVSTVPLFQVKYPWFLSWFLHKASLLWSHCIPRTPPCLWADQLPNSKAYFSCLGPGTARPRTPTSALM